MSVFVIGLLITIMGIAFDVAAVVALKIGVTLIQSGLVMLSITQIYLIQTPAFGGKVLAVFYLMKNGHAIA